MKSSVFNNDFATKEKIKLFINRSHYFTFLFFVTFIVFKGFLWQQRQPITLEQYNRLRFLIKDYNYDETQVLNNIKKRYKLYSLEQLTQKDYKEIIGYYKKITK